MLRSILASEISLIERAISVAPTDRAATAKLTALGYLRVTGHCDCGCGTVWFGPDRNASNGALLADAVATSDGEFVQLLVWGSESGEIIGLEVVGFRADPVPLPDLDSVRTSA
jgi:hypothetical protein